MNNRTFSNTDNLKVIGKVAMTGTMVLIGGTGRVIFGGGEFLNTTTNKGITFLRTTDNKSARAFGEDAIGKGVSYLASMGSAPEPKTEFGLFDLK